jgi:hypothetical protein
LISGIDENIERLENVAKAFSDTISVVTEIQNKIKEREKKRDVIDALIELTDVISENIEDIDTATAALGDLASEGGRTLTPPDAGRLERAIKFAISNLSQIGETLAVANQIAGSRFPIVIALLRSLENQHNDLLTVLTLMPTPTSENPRIDPSIGYDIELFRTKKNRAVAEVQRIKSRLQELR